MKVMDIYILLVVNFLIREKKNDFMSAEMSNNLLSEVVLNLI